VKERSCKLTIALRQSYDSYVSCGITGHAGQGALPGNDRGCRISDYYRSGRTLVFKLISWLAGEWQTLADSSFKNILGSTAISEFRLPFNYYLSLFLSSLKTPLDLALAGQPLALCCTFSLDMSKPVTVGRSKHRKY